MLSPNEIANRKIQNHRANIVLIGLGLFIMGFFLLVLLSSFFPATESFAVAPNMAPTVAPAPKAFDACVMAQVFVKQNLKSPATADFPACNGPDTSVSHLSGNTWKVSSYVDAQNGFGALLRADYSTEMRYDPTTDKWTLVSFNLVNR